MQPKPDRRIHSSLGRRLLELLRKRNRGRMARSRPPGHRAAAAVQRDGARADHDSARLGSDLCAAAVGERRRCTADGRRARSPLAAHLHSGARRDAAARPDRRGQPGTAPPAGSDLYRRARGFPPSPATSSSSPRRRSAGRAGAHAVLRHRNHQIGARHRAAHRRSKAAQHKVGRPPKKRSASGHAVALSRVLLNLTTNALKFTDVGTVELWCGRDRGSGRPERIRFSVRDNGHGIPAEKLTTLFQPLRKDVGRRGQLFSQSGLGLAICRQLVSAMKSELQVESRVGEGAGTRFFFDLDLPIVPARRSGARAAPRHQRRTGGAHQRSTWPAEQRIAAAALASAARAARGRANRCRWLWQLEVGGA